jgi:hypothetical protein
VAEFLFKRSDYTHSDPEKDWRGVHKKTDIINYKPDGWSSHPNWAASSYPKDFIVIKVPEITFAEAEASDHRKPWKDDFDYQVVATRPARGEYDLRIFEKNPGASNQNAITGAKVTKVRNYLTAWGCSNFSLTATDANFMFSLWNAVRSASFWEVPLIGTKVSFALNSYSGTTGIGNITATAIAGQWGDQTEIQIGNLIVGKITERGGMMLSQIYPNFIFTIDRAILLARFRADVKFRTEQIYIRHQYSISQADHDTIIAAGGIVTITKAAFLSKVINKMEVV